MEPGEDVSIEIMKELRVQIDACIKRAKNLADTRPAKGGAEVTLAYRNLQMAKMWCGKVMEEVGSELPKEFRDEAK